MIHLVTDSTADFSADEAAALNVRVVPLTVIIGPEELRDRVDITPDQFYARLIKGDIQPTTSQPSPEAFGEVYRDLLRADGDHVLSVHLSSKLSGTSQSAHLAAQDFDGRVAVIDSLTISGGLQTFLRHARRLADSGASLNDAVAALEARKQRSYLYLILDTLTYLHRGGRIGGASAFVGGILGVKPVLELREGLIQPSQRARSFRKGVDAAVEMVKAKGALDAIDVMYTTNRDIADSVAAEFRMTHAGVDVHVGQIGPVVGTYVGPGALGVAFFGAE